MLLIARAWVAESVKLLTPDFRSGHDLTVCGIEPRVGLYTDGVEPAWDSLSLPLSLSFSLSLPLSCSCCLSLSKINVKKKQIFLVAFYIASPMICIQDIMIQLLIVSQWWE